MIVYNRRCSKTYARYLKRVARNHARKASQYAPSSINPWALRRAYAKIARIMRTREGQSNAEVKRYLALQDVPRAGVQGVPEPERFLRRLRRAAKSGIGPLFDSTASEYNPG